jgi:hypothetical protein
VAGIASREERQLWKSYLHPHMVPSGLFKAMLVFLSVPDAAIGYMA